MSLEHADYFELKTIKMPLYLLREGPWNCSSQTPLLAGLSSSALEATTVFRMLWPSLGDNHPLKKNGRQHAGWGRSSKALGTPPLASLESVGTSLPSAHTT